MRKFFNFMVTLFCLAPLVLTIAAIAQYEFARRDAQERFELQQARHRKEMMKRVKEYKKTLAERQ